MIDRLLLRCEVLDGDRLLLHYEILHEIFRRFFVALERLLWNLMLILLNSNRPIAYRKIKGLGFCTGVC